MSVDDHVDLVREIKTGLEARGVVVTGSLSGAFEATKRVAWALRHEGAGLLLKASGENIVEWHGVRFSASRVCFPDGHLWKVLTDVPTTNGPSWQDNGVVDRGLYLPAIDPGDDPPAPPPAPDDRAARFDAIDRELEFVDRDLAELRAILVEVRQDFASATNALRLALKEFGLTGVVNLTTGATILVPGKKP